MFPSMIERRPNKRSLRELVRGAMDTALELVTLGEARTSVQQSHWRHMLTWLHAQCQAGASPEDLFERLVA